MDDAYSDWLDDQREEREAEERRIRLLERAAREHGRSLGKDEGYAKGITDVAHPVFKMAFQQMAENMQRGVEPELQGEFARIAGEILSSAKIEVQSRKRHDFKATEVIAQIYFPARQFHCVQAISDDVLRMRGF